MSDVLTFLSARGRCDKMEREYFGHIRPDSVNLGQWFGLQFGSKVGAEKVLVDHIKSLNNQL